MNRTRFKYNVVALARRSEHDQPSSVELDFDTYWSPKFEGILDIVANACCAMATYLSGKKVHYEPVSASLVDPQPAA